MGKISRKGRAIVISVGGSLVVTNDGIATGFLKSFRTFIARRAKKGDRFYLIVGGGVTARKYIQAASETAPVADSDRDWIGIAATRLNAQLVRASFGKLAYPEIITDPTRKIASKAPLVIAAGYKPGWSTDYVAVLLAKANKIDTVINLSNIDYAYDKDPRQFKDAKKLEYVSWAAFRKIVGNRWRPGLNVPFDPIASREAAAAKMQVVIMNGQKLDKLRNCLDGKAFPGTIIGRT